MKKKEIVFLLCILALGAFFRFYDLKNTPPGLYPDEAMNGNNDLEALATNDFKVFYPENNGREGLFINLQAISVKVFGNEPWALRLVSAIMGTFTILGLFFVTKELFKREAIISLNGRQEVMASLTALLASFLIATNYWHLNFSRIGFRAIMLPLMASWAMYFLLRGLRTGKILLIVTAGIFIGLGLYTYIAFRFMIFAFLVPIVWYLWRWKKNLLPNKSHCIPCLVAMGVLIVLAVSTPFILHFLNNPQDFVSRSSQISIFSATSPVKEFLISNVATVGMLFVHGDCNWRHNLACAPELNPIVAVFFLIGLWQIIKNRKKMRLACYTLFGWLMFMMLPVTLTREGIPHALRSIGMIPPVMVVSAFGGYSMMRFIYDIIEKKKEKFPQIQKKLNRLQKEFAILFLLILCVIPVMTYRDYFRTWANNPNTYFAFATDLWHLGEYLRDLPPDVKKYVIVNMPGTDVRGIPTPAQTVMFATDTFPEQNRVAKNMAYVLPDRLDSIQVAQDERVVIALLNGSDTNLRVELKKRFPLFMIYAPQDFVILQNYGK